MKFCLAMIFALTSMSVFADGGFKQVQCRFNGQHELQKKKFLSSQYKTTNTNHVSYTVFGPVNLDLLNETEEVSYGYNISGMFGAFSIKFELKKQNEEDFTFEVTSRGQKLATIPFNINNTLTPETDFLNIKDTEITFVTAEQGNKRAVITKLTASCKRIQ